MEGEEREADKERENEAAPSPQVKRQIYCLDFQAFNFPSFFPFFLTDILFLFHLFPQRNQCAVCHTSEGRLMRCTGCQLTYYCSKEHQKEHWKDHRLQCRLEKKRREEREREKEREKEREEGGEGARGGSSERGVIKEKVHFCLKYPFYSEFVNVSQEEEMGVGLCGIHQITDLSFYFHALNVYLLSLNLSLSHSPSLSCVVAHFFCPFFPSFSL